MFCVKNFSKIILGCVFMILIICSVQPIDADHHLAGPSIFKDLTRVNLIDEWDSEYQIYLHVEVRNGQGQLVSISEDSIGRLVPHELTAHTFNEKMGKIEIVTIDNIKYEKIQLHEDLPAEALLVNSQTSHYIGLWRVIMCGEIIGHGHPCVPVFQVNTPVVFITEGDVITLHWTVLRIIN